MNKIRQVFVPFILPLTLFFFLRGHDLPESAEKGTLSIYFFQEQVGYEEYSWEEREEGYSLFVRGRMTKPIAIEIERLEIYLDKNFIVERYFFRGRVSGVEQEIRSFLSGGKAVNTKRVAGQEQTETVTIRRDAFLLPNPIFSPYIVLTKKFRCGLQERIDLSAYIIPQMEVPATLEPIEGIPCRLKMNLGHTQLEMETDEDGTLNLLDMSSQNLRVVRTR
jgi:hypothetical protein